MEPELTRSMDVPAHPDPHIEAENKKYFTFFNLSIALIVLTAIELVIIYLPFSAFFIMASLVVLSGLKFIGVIWWFMHLRWDHLMVTLLFLAGMLIATGTVTALLFLFEGSATGAPEGL